MVRWIALLSTFAVASCATVQRMTPGCPFYRPPSAVAPATLSAASLEAQGSMNPNFYTTEQRQCIVKHVRGSITSIATVDDYPGLIRLAFHDALAGGANGSLMKQKSEQTLQPTLMGFEIVDMLKNMTEKACGLRLSYADTLVLISVASTYAMGGPDFLDRLQLGRADVPFADAPELVPTGDWTTLPQCERWRQVGFSIKDTVAIAGAHSVGQVHCTSIYARFVLMNDSWMEPDLWDTISETCQEVFNGTIPVQPEPVGGGGRNVGPQVDLDQLTPDVFDNGYFRGLVRGLGILLSDQALYSDLTIPETRYWVEKFAEDNSVFLQAYEDAFLKMSTVGLTVATLPLGQYPPISSHAGCLSCCPDSATILNTLVSS